MTIVIIAKPPPTKLQLFTDDRSWRLNKNESSWLKLKSLLNQINLLILSFWVIRNRIQVLTLYLGGLIVSSDFRDNYIRLRYNVNESLISGANPLVNAGRESPHKRRRHGVVNRNRSSNSGRTGVLGHHEQNRNN